MPTPLEICTDVIVNHEKQTFAEVSDDFKGTVLEAFNRAVRYLYGYSDWTFRVQYQTGYGYAAAGPNPLPEQFLSFNQTGAVWLRVNDVVIREIPYKPLPEVIRLIKGPNQPQSGYPEVFSLGGALDGASVTNQREIFLWPNVDSDLDLAYQAVAPGPFVIAATGNPWSWEDPIPRIPVSWHYVLRELTVVFRLIDKEGDSSRYQELLKTCMKTMLEQEPHGRENTNIRLPKKLGWRMGRR